MSCLSIFILWRFANLFVGIIRSTINKKKYNKKINIFKLKNCKKMFSCITLTNWSLHLKIMHFQIKIWKIVLFSQAVFYKPSFRLLRSKILFVTKTARITFNCLYTYKNTSIRRSNIHIHNHTQSHTFIPAFLLDSWYRRKFDCKQRSGSEYLLLDLWSYHLGWWKSSPLFFVFDNLFHGLKFLHQSRRIDDYSHSYEKK